MEGAQREGQGSGRITRRRLVTTAAYATAAVALQACVGPAAVTSPSPTAAGATAAGASSAPATQAPLTGTVVIAVLPGNTDKVMRLHAQAFMDKNPGVKVDVANQGGDVGEYIPKVTALLRASDGPDLVWLQHQDNWDTVLKAGLIEPMDDVWQQAGLDNAFPPAVRELWTEQDGHHYGAPIAQGFLPLIYYNKQHFAKAGVNPPGNGIYYTSNAELFTNIDKLRSAGLYGMTMTGKPVFWFDHQWSGLANNLLTPAELVALVTNWKPGTTPSITWDDRRAVKIFEVQAEYVRRAYVDGFLARSYDESRALFVNGKASLMSDGDWSVSLIKSAAQPDFDYGWMTYPQQRDDLKPKVPVANVDTLVLSKTSKNKQAAKAFFAFILSPDRQVAQADVLSPTRTDLRADALKAKMLPQNADMVTKLGPIGGYWWQTYVNTAVNQALDDALANLVAGKATPEQAGKSVEAVAEKSRKGG